MTPLRAYKETVSSTGAIENSHIQFSGQLLGYSGHCIFFNTVTVLFYDLSLTYTRQINKLVFRNYTHIQFFVYNSAWNRGYI